ncbi:tRNA 2-selenouridine(34) synthase MnmH [Candidatus Thiothrix sp. Deng01]|uniref:tRNA 2-selenouridine synthase n=1 Tax=Candidatus Thiothrix phosphatis TaxID=3112415 RepID=A0ABU6CZ24_9GAMM|nr:tRNA 2-selenouridine(34) synthase MnmH [Candidatus Thiothrix sp. Deng01]MEB4591816.1 tRNA 2-selenouridine(34) synthase MnmH [Candidatus Thiothrix sp. Deng01]
MPLSSAGKNLPVVADLQTLFLQDTPMLDVRAPIEFREGAFPSSANLPLMDDADRDAIGKRYKQLGQDAAIELGLQRVSGGIKASRVNAWEAFARQHPAGVLYCFRGGLRSRISQQWLYEQTGIAYPRVQGGYKAMRRFLLEQLETVPPQLQPVILSGRTGSGKTRFLRSFHQQIDLEALANHRGSAFGAQPTPQPTQINFENALAIQLMRKCHRGQRALLFEDESRRIGSLHNPDTLFNILSDAPVALMQIADEERVEISHQEYVADGLAAFTKVHGGDSEAGFIAFSGYLLGSLDKIQRRLGGMRHQQARKMMQTALRQQAMTGSLTGHYDWVRFLLLDYYDPMYDYQISGKQGRLAFSGSPAEVREYLRNQGIT